MQTDQSKTEGLAAVDLQRLVRLVDAMHICGCSTGSFIYGCGHAVRRLKAILHALELNADPDLCHICIRELGRERGEAINAPVQCDCCGAWQCYKSKQPNV